MKPLPDNPLWSKLFRAGWRHWRHFDPQESVQDCGPGWYFCINSVSSSGLLSRLRRHPLTSHYRLEPALYDQLVVTDYAGTSNLIIIRIRNALRILNTKKHIEFIAFATDDEFVAQVVLFADVLFGG